MAARARSRSTYHHGDLRRALLDEARALIEERELEGFTLRELARRVGVTHGAAYRHFQDKRELLVAIALEGYADLTAALRSRAATGASLDRHLVSLARAYVAWALDHPAAYRVMFGPRLNEDGAFPEIESAIEASFESVDGVLVREGGFAPARAREITVSFLTQLHGYTDLVRARRVRVRGRAGALRYVERLVGPLARGVREEAAAG